MSSQLTDAVLGLLRIGSGNTSGLALFAGQALERDVLRQVVDPVVLGGTHHLIQASGACATRAFLVGEHVLKSETPMPSGLLVRDLTGLE
jgi:hypothetical protein